MDGDGLVALVRERRGEMSIMGMVMVCGLWFMGGAIRFIAVVHNIF